MQDQDDWRQISGEPYDWKLTRKPERPYQHDYAHTLTVKLGLAGRDFARNQAFLYFTLDEVYEIIQTFDLLTLGVPKILYLVWWQYNWYDQNHTVEGNKYPSLDKVNPALKRPGDASAEESLRWLMDAALRFNTTVSLHINLKDAYDNSPLFNTYVEEGLICRNKDGSLKKAGFWGKQAYYINYKREWESGRTKERIDRLLTLLPVKRAGTIHIDAFNADFSDDYFDHTILDMQEAQRKIIRYFRACGIDVTNEFMNCERISLHHSAAKEDQLIGLVPMTYFFGQQLTDYLDRPASLICGGETGHYLIKPGGEQFAGLFGESFRSLQNLMWDPEILKKPHLQLLSSPKAIRSDWPEAVLEAFCLQFVPFCFLNSFERLSASCTHDNITAQFSGHVTTRIQGTGRHPCIWQDGVLLRDHTDVMIPILWMDQAPLLTFSQAGGIRTWQLPLNRRERDNLQIRALTRDGLDQAEQLVVIDGGITLKYKPGQAFLIQ